MNLVDLTERNIKLYSWKDAERILRLNKQIWMDHVHSIETYRSEIVININEIHNKEQIENIFQKIFPKNFTTENDELGLKLDLDEKILPITYDETSGISPDQIVLPFFRDAIYSNTVYPKEKLNELLCPVIGFHSYKGGVGRTLTLLTFAKAWSEVCKTKLLIVDADLEAPGLTWMCVDESKENRADYLSYMDFLTMAQDMPIDRQFSSFATTGGTDFELNHYMSKLGEITLNIGNPTHTFEHIIMPTYRYKEQLLDIYATPETVANSSDKAYFLTEAISKLGADLGVGAVLLDLRAGLSEYSTPWLFDPRVIKYIVTSTSKQSVSGTKIILEHISKGLDVKNNNTYFPNIVLSMIPTNLDPSERNDIKTQLRNFYYQDSILNDSINDSVDESVIELLHYSELIHIHEIGKLIEDLSRLGIYKTVKEHVESNYSKTKEPSKEISNMANRADVLKKINDLADAQVTTERNQNFEMLMISPIKKLKNKFRNEIPQTVILGTKGAGKTFLFRNFLQKKTWDKFLDDDKLDSTFFVPIIASKSLKNLKEPLESCIEYCNTHIQSVQIKRDCYLDNALHGLSELKKIEGSMPSDFYVAWEKLIAQTIHPDFSTFEEIQEKLKNEEKRVILLFDGLEEHFFNHQPSNQEMRTKPSNQEMNAISTLCQEVVSMLNSRYTHIGIIVFMRRDIVRNAIRVNFEQFEGMYKDFELKWSHVEAKRLAAWLVDRAGLDIFNGIDIENATDDVIEEGLCMLWGEKLGRHDSREANSSRWIRAALSDFNLQLQARDMIRFLKYATETPSKRLTYTDRYIMPTEIKSAIPSCSIDKIQELQAETPGLEIIFNKLKENPIDNKKIPFFGDKIFLSLDEESFLVSLGFLKKETDRYYLPEIIRHDLGFQYVGGGRAKILSLVGL